MERNPFTNENELHCYYVLKEIKRVSAELASFPKALSLGRPAIYIYKLTIFAYFSLNIHLKSDRVFV